MIEIYLDGVLLDNSKYIGFRYDYKPFEDEFFLGSTGIVNATLTIPLEDLPSSLSSVQIKIDGKNYLSLVVNSITNKDDAQVELELSDILSTTSVEYDFSDSVPISAKQLLNKICEDFSISHDEFNFTNQDVVIDSYDSTVTAREYISMIAELSGGYVYINSDGKLKLDTYLQNHINITPDKLIKAEDIDTYKLGESIIIERVVYEFGERKFETSSDTSLYTLYLNQNNMFLQNTTDEELQNLVGNILGFQFNNIEIGSSINFYRDVNILGFVDLNNITYRILNQMDATFFGAFLGSYKSNINTTKEDFSKVTTDETRIRRIQQEIDQTNASMKIIAQDVSDNTGNISSLQVQASQISSNIETLETGINSRFNQLSNSFEFNLNAVSNTVTQNNEEVNQRINEIHDYLRYELEYVETDDKYYIENKDYYIKQDGAYILYTDYIVGEIIEGIKYEYTGVLTLGTAENPIVLKEKYNMVYFYQDGRKVAYISNNKLYITDGEFLSSLRIGNFAFIPRNNGSLGFRKVG